MNIKVKVKEILSQIEKNKAQHLIDYAEAVEAYKKEAQKQLDRQQKDLNEGGLSLKLELVSPVNNEQEYNDMTKKFQWETREEVELTEREFNEIILDKAPVLIHSRFLNSTYK